MRAVVVYESMYGNTHLVADAVGTGLAQVAGTEVSVVPVADATPEVVDAADLLVVGGPTHVHSMASAASRRAAVAAAEKPESGLTMDPDAMGEGLREWFTNLGHGRGNAAAFDTRVDASPAFTGRASKAIAKRLRRHGWTAVAEPESFLVNKGTHLLDHEADRARAWGASLVAASTDPVDAAR